MSPKLAAVAITALLAVPALAEDSGDKKPHYNCHVSKEKGDRMVQGKDLVVEAGEKVHDAVALDGNVIIHKGARVHSVVALQGSVTIEPGARVDDDVVALGGDVRVGQEAHVEGDAVALGGQLQVQDSAQVDGDRVSLSLAFGGKDVVRGFLEKVVNKDLRCHIVEAGGDKEAAHEDN